MKINRKDIIFIIVLLICILLDQSVKYLITSSMNVVDTIQIIRNFLRITYVQNIGAAWSMFSGNSTFLIGLGILSVILICYLYYKDHRNNFILFAILLGGIIGNLIDRIRLGYVVDYIDMNFGNYQYPIFNIADILIVLSVIILVIKMWKEEKDDDTNKGDSK